ncbi:MAG TPA: BTAD domain-containing putative transcriptional regulator [Solirubrobacteraceae bacterium]|jgi:predicted ATPase/DNA-binding SARP family transcriptional activator
MLERENRSIALPSGRPRSLLALLLMASGTPISRDRLIDELWGEHPPASAVSALHVHLSKLRELLGDLMVRDAAGYSMRTEGFELDCARFDALVTRARSEPAEARVLLREALGLVRGEPLCDVPAEGGVAQWRRALEEKCLQAQLLRIDADMAAGATGELVPELETLVSAHPFEERIWGQLMLALYRSGRQADALDAFARARRALASELGLEPGEQLLRLQTQMLQHELDGGTELLAAPEPVVATAELVAPASPEPPRRASNLPAAVTKLVGREPELAILQSLLTDADVRVVTLIGPGGVGKTRLAIELARRIEPDYRDGAVFVRLERLTDPALVAAEIASALGHRAGTDGPGADGLARYLRDLELLLVIDNFEHLLPAAVLVSELLELTPQIKVLVSSRTALRIRGERLLTVQPLELPTGGSDDEIVASPAVQLFVERARAAEAGLDLTPDSYRTIAAICEALDGLPLAIELAASRAHLLTLEDIHEQLSRPLVIGERSLRDLPDRHQTLRATIGWSYDLLSEAAQAVLRAAGVFIGGFTLAALEAVVGRMPADELAELQESSLVRRQADARRFEMLELVRAFAREKCQDAGESANVAARHRRYFAELAAPASAEFDIGVEVGLLSIRLRAEHANIRAAFDDAVANGDEESATMLALALRPLWIAGNLRQESIEFAERLLGRFSLSGPDELALLRIVAALEHGSGEWQRRFADRAAELGDSEALGVATAQLFAVAITARDREEMARLHPVLESLISDETSPRVLGWVYYSLFGEAYLDNRFEPAYENACLSVERARETGHSYMLVCALEARLLARSAMDRGITQPEVAEVFELACSYGVHSVVVAAIWFVARYAAAVDPESARRWLTLAERISTEFEAAPSLEEVLRAETMEVLGITDLGPLLAAAPPFDQATALDDVAAWVASRSPTEVAPRDPVLRP